MAQTIKLRRSATTGNVPTTAQLALGEVALNTFDGRAFIKKDNGAESIEHLITTNSETTGSINLIGNITASGAISASGDLFINTSDAAGSSYNTLMVDTATGKVYHTGSYGGGGGGGGIFTQDGNYQTTTNNIKITGSLEVSGSSLEIKDSLTSPIISLNRNSGAGNSSYILFNEYGFNSSAPSPFKDTVWHVGNDYNSGNNSFRIGSGVVSSLYREAFIATQPASEGASPRVGIGIKSVADINTDLYTLTISGSTRVVDGNLQASSGSLIVIQTGSLNGLDYIPVSEGGTYTSPSPSSPSIITATMLFEHYYQNSLVNLNQSHTINTGTNYTGNVTIKQISASGDLDSAGEYISNLTIGGQNLVAQWGITNDGTIQTAYVPMFDNDNDVTLNPSYPASIVYDTFGAGDATQVDCVNGIIDVTLSITPGVSANTPAGGGPGSGYPILSFEIEIPDQISGTPGTFGKGIIAGDSTQINEIAHFINIATGSSTPSSGLRITLGTEQGVQNGFSGVNNTSFINCYTTDGVNGLSKIGTAYSGLNGVDWQTVSDERLKENIVLSNQGLNIINNLKVKEFNFNYDKSKTPLVGFIAQELYEIIPQAVHKGGDDPKLDPWSIQPKILIPYLVNALQQQQKQIEELQAQINQLKTNTK